MSGRIQVARVAFLRHAPRELVFVADAHGTAVQIRVAVTFAPR